MRRLHGHALVALIAVGCGGDGAACRPDALTVPSTLQLVSLSGVQRPDVCDYTACEVGGYGVTLSCPGGTAVTVASSQQQCLARWPSNAACHATVADLVDCTAAIRANPCASTLFGSACEAVSDPQCVTFTPSGSTIAVTFGRRAAADALRQELRQRGVLLEDTPQGVRWRLAD
jgi:hypothetical protein